MPFWEQLKDLLVIITRVADTVGDTDDQRNPWPRITSNYVFLDSAGLRITVRISKKMNRTVAGLLPVHGFT